MVYDYKTRTTVKVTDTVFKSEVEQKLSDEKVITNDNKAKKEKEKADKDENDKKNNKDGNDNEKNELDPLGTGATKSIETKTFIKEIGFALQRKDTQKTVLIIKLV